RLRGFKSTVANYQASLEQTSNDLKQLAADSMFFLDTSQQRISADFHVSNKLRMQIRQKEIQTTQKLDSLGLLVSEATRLRQETESLLANLSARQYVVQVVKKRR